MVRNNTEEVDAGPSPTVGPLGTSTSSMPNSMAVLVEERNVAEVENKQPEKEEQLDSKHSITVEREEAVSTTSHNGEVVEEIE